MTLSQSPTSPSVNGVSQDTERAAFEAWYGVRRGTSQLGKIATGRYEWDVTQDAWMAWKAGRAAIAVQPPAASQPSDEQIADAVPLTATVLEIEGERLKVCMTKTEVLAFARTVLALAAVQGKK